MQKFMVKYTLMRPQLRSLRHKKPKVAAVDHFLKPLDSFQEVVLLNAGNVLGAEDNKPILKMGSNNF
jgi:hypothetical protein